MTQDNGAAPAGPAKGKGAWPRLALLALAVAALMAAAHYFDLGQRLTELRGWIAAQGAWGPAIFVLVYAGATVAMIPGTVLTFAAGPLFGSVVGVVAVSLGSTLGAALAFLASRHLARQAVASRLAGNPTLARLDRMSQRHGDIIVAITRLVPLFPFNLLNYALGLTRVSFWSYVFWSWLCMLPATVIYVVGADAVATGLAQGRVPWALIGVVLAGVVILVLLVRRARARLRADEPEGPPPSEENHARAD